MFRRAIVAGLALILASIALGPGAAARAASPQISANVDAVVKDFQFVPQVVVVKAGSTVTWRNDGPSTHTVTADDGSFDSGNLAAGTTFPQTFAQSGLFKYHCSIHTSMQGTVFVASNFVFVPAVLK